MPEKIIIIISRFLCNLFSMQICFFFLVKIYMYLFGMSCFLFKCMYRYIIYPINVFKVLRSSALKYFFHYKNHIFLSAFINGMI